MTRPPARPAGNPRSRFLPSAWLRLTLALGTLAILGAAAYCGWYLFLRPAGPPPVDLGALPTSSATPGPSTGAGAATAGPAFASPGPTVASSTTLDGTWQVNTSVGSGTTGSFVGYRVQEQLATIGANTAVGRTSNVSGSFVLEGTRITAAEITADLTSLQSDDTRRDGQLRRQGLETSTYPTTTFVLTQPVDLGSIPSDGQIVKTQATGQLTLHGQTRTVQIPLEARLSGGVVAVTGSLPIVFADYGIQAPSSFMVLSVANQGTIELQLMFTHA